MWVLLRCPISPQSSAQFCILLPLTPPPRVSALSHDFSRGEGQGLGTWRLAPEPKSPVKFLNRHTRL